MNSRSILLLWFSSLLFNNLRYRILLKLTYYPRSFYFTHLYRSAEHQSSLPAALSFLCHHIRGCLDHPLSIAQQVADSLRSYETLTFVLPHTLFQCIRSANYSD
jgi:hypothetical protein